MRVLIKLFDREPIKNVLSASIFAPEIVVYLCDQRHGDLFKESAIYRFFRRRGLRCRPRFYYVDAWSPAAVRRALRAVVRDYPGCIFDFTGGKDLLLGMAGMMVSEMNLPAFHIDIRRRRFSNLRNCEALDKRFHIPSFSAADLLAVTGATVHGYGHISPQQLTPAFEADARAVFSLLMEHQRDWNDFVNYLQVCCAGTGPDELDMGGAKTMSGERQLVHYSPELMEALHRKGIFTRYGLDGKGVFFSFKSPLIKRCMLSVGVWLELYCYLCAKNTGFFDELISSVVIDWDGVEGGPDTAKNEVDLLLVKGVTPVFVSCKMGTPSALALSEVKQLTEKFSGSFGRTAMVTAQKLGKDAAVLQNRAEELRILMLDKRNMEEDNLGQRLVELASGSAPRPAPPPLSIPKGKKVW